MQPRYLPYHDTLVGRVMPKFFSNKFFLNDSHQCSYHNDLKIGLFVGYFLMGWVLIRAGVYCPHLWAQLVNPCLLNWIWKFIQTQQPYPNPDNDQSWYSDAKCESIRVSTEANKDIPIYDIIILIPCSHMFERLPPSVQYCVNERINTNTGRTVASKEVAGGRNFGCDVIDDFSLSYTPCNRQKKWDTPPVPMVL